MHHLEISTTLAHLSAAPRGQGAWRWPRLLHALRPGPRHRLAATQPCGTASHAGPQRGRAAACAGAAMGLLIGLAGAARPDGTDPASVTIDNFTFAPATIDIRQGQAVTWTNRDDIPHVVVVPGVQARSKTLDTDDSDTVRFEKAGTFDYICGLHPAMRGRVVVH